MASWSSTPGSRTRSLPPATGARCCSASVTRRCSSHPMWPRWCATPARSFTLMTAKSPRCALTGSAPPRWMHGPRPSGRHSLTPIPEPTTPTAMPTSCIRRSMNSRGWLSGRSACGSAYYAGLLGAQLIEELARIPADAEAASEFRYRNPVVEPDTLYVAVSQSGETYDTLAAVQELKRKGGRVLGVVNAVGGTIPRECEGGVYLHAGPEISVTSTKTFTATAVVFALLALHLGRIHDLSPSDGSRITAGLRALPAQIAQILADEERLAQVARQLMNYPGMFFVGRVRGWPVAREGAQKLKEVSYLHAEAYPASELKHGPLALVGPELPTVAVVPDDELFEKNLSTLGEIRARGGRIFAVSHRELEPKFADEVIRVPKNEPELDPILLSVPLQLLAYHAAVGLGNDVDKPRNLAKSVTVE